jgi:hypothetical protein
MPERGKGRIFSGFRRVLGSSLGGAKAVDKYVVINHSEARGGWSCA